MSLLAYGNDAAFKQQLIQRLRARPQASQWLAQPLHWNGEAGSLAGTVLQGDDLDEWENAYGLPKWLALALDGLLVSAPDTAQGARAGVDLLDAIAPGADVTTAGSRCLLDLLHGTAYGLQALPAAEALKAPLDAVADLHRALAQGQAVTAKQWRHARRLAVEATNALTAGTPEVMISACIEAAAWDPATSRTAVSDALRTWSWAMNAATGPSANMPDMSDEEDTRIRALLRRLYDDAKAQAENLEEHIDVLKLASEKHPDVYARMRANMDWQRSQQQQFWAEQWRRSVTVVHAALTV